MSTAQHVPTGLVEQAPASARGRVLAVLLLTWLAANTLTHIIVAIATGGIYYQLPFLALISAEASIALLNFLLPIVAVRLVLRESLSFGSTFGWTWTGWRIPVLAGAGFLAFMLLASASNSVFGNQVIAYGAPGMAGPVSRVDYLIMTLMLLALPAMGEETMFRGFLQTRFTAMYGSALGILLPAVLFAVRHHPSDVYFGAVNHVPLAGWANRGVQLYLGAVMFGLVRHWARSTWASWAFHMMIILFILVLGGFFGRIIGS